ncbi:peptidylprolyl isomerase [Paenibacillus sp. N4]|uniref:peptidylprolyl isomerase n=1 Tax=Paenibacillus vietnamensis TaxID=2590547 RepID=UPI001CD08794|nr:peptidylprolyl isomerase [Paenibacillus vietnamensis]MCA0758356.1 peptidylprolyl isomerase [Paenibacillus vietnamensis]
MRKYEVLRAVVILQAVCMVVLTVMVVVKVWPEGPEWPDNAAGTNAGSGEEAGPSGNKEIARVGGTSITSAELESQLYKQYGDAVLRTLMVHKAIDLEAAAAGLSVSPEELEDELQQLVQGYDSESQYFEVMREQLGMTKEQVLAELNYRLLLEKIAVKSVVVTDEEVQSYIDGHREEFDPRQQLHLQWILTESEQEANSVLQKLSEGEDFALLARTYSIDAFTADVGGDLGLIDDDDPFYDEEMLETASRLQIAEMAGPFEVDGGFAVIRLVERQTTAALSGERLYDTVRKQLALERAESLASLEESLLAKYEAVKYN